jgi:predicted Zn-dependent protease
MADGEECNQVVREKMAPAHGYHELGMHEDAWKTLDNLPPEDKADPIVILLRLDILLALHRLEDAVALGTGACRQWPTMASFFVKTVAALMELNDHEKAKDLLLAGPPSLQQKAAYWYNLARCHGRLGDVDRGRKCLWECINRDKNFRAKALDDPDLEPVWKSLG